jgi:hypothetical protein
MRKLILAAALTATAAIVAGTVKPAQAREIAWCLRSPSNGWNGDCMYYTYAQCLAALSGQRGECRPNPFAAPRAERPRRHRRTDD